MTLAARKTLSDLRRAHEMLEVEEDIASFRVLWVGAISLARSVGHVLDKIDARTSPKMREAISNAYVVWKANKYENSIFFEFIESERNSVLKEYEFGFMSGPIDIVVSDGSVHSLTDNLFCPLGYGSYTGEDCRDALADAIHWWELQLESIERAAAI